MNCISGIILFCLMEMVFLALIVLLNYLKNKKIKRSAEKIGEICKTLIINITPIIIEFYKRKTSTTTK